MTRYLPKCSGQPGNEVKCHFGYQLRCLSLYEEQNDKSNQSQTNKFCLNHLVRQYRALLLYLHTKKVLKAPVNIFHYD